MQIKVNRVSFSYVADAVITDLSLDVAAGETILILGENGSGKTTLLQLILGQLKPSSGSVELLGKKVDTLRSFRDIGYVPQVHSVERIAFPITVLELVVLGLYEHYALIKIPRRRHKERAKEVLREMGLEAYIHAPFNELSGGLRQRAMIARAMVNHPKILILDEPTAGVDEESKTSFLQLLKDMNEKHGITLVIVTHELAKIEEALTPNRIYRMNEGRMTHA